MTIKINEFDIQTITGRIHVKRISPDTEKKNGGLTLTFLHEGLGCIEMWHDFPEAMVKVTGLDAVVFDRYGYGKSSKLSSGKADSGYLDREAFKHLPEILEICSIKNPFFIGHSDGGTIALLYASRYPEKVSGLVSESAHTFVDTLTTKGISNALKSFETSGLREKLFKYHKDNTDFSFYRWANTWLSSKHLNWDITDQLKKIVCPVLTIQGEKDNYGTYAQPDSITQNVSGISEQLMIEDCFHVPHHEKRNIVVDTIAAFINNHIIKNLSVY
jgi:pimeloyl-ACP methyl ester carboxylesterase